ncbi:MAG: hypothetical protein JWN99_2473 [Ilumatobacteraceae bacterium]|nr:hypothetical protein [Ilumatobacteraceae bacterium]
MLLAGCVLIVLAGGLRRRNALAALLAFGYFGIVVVGGAAGSHLRSIIGVLAVLASIAAFRESILWPAKSKIDLAMRLGGATVLMLLASGFASSHLAGDGPVRDSVPAAIRTTVERSLGIGDPADPLARSRTLGAIVPALAALGILAVLIVLMQSAPDVPEQDDEIRWSIARLCASSGSDSLAPFTRRHDKSFVFSDDGRAAIGYRVVFGVCIAGPGPVGAADAHADALAAFVRRCDLRGWRPAMIGASDRARRLASQSGLRGMRIGDEAVLPVSTFRLDRPQMRNVRQAVKRTLNAGVTVDVHREGDLDERALAELRAVLDDWRRGRGELGFSMTLDRLLEGEHPDALLVIARHDGHAVGFQRYLSCRSGKSLSLDVMPRLHAAPNGVNERLIVEAIVWANAHAVADVSLNFAAFRTVFEGDSRVRMRLLRWGVHTLDPLINVESLYRFNAKFRPDWVPRHVLYRSPLDLPALLCAALRVEFGSHRANPTAPAPALGVARR